MSNITIKDKVGVAYSMASSTAYIDKARFKIRDDSKPLPQTMKKCDFNAVPWAIWGEDNLLPQQLTADIETCGILNSIIEGKARFSICQGMVPAICTHDEKGNLTVKNVVDDPEIRDFLDMNGHFNQVFALMKDFAAFNMGMVRFGLNKGRDKIVRFQRDDITEVRLKKQNDKGVIETAYLSAEWERVTNVKHESIIQVPLLDSNNPYWDLKERSDGLSFGMLLRNPGWGKKYYSSPMWASVYKWVKIAQGVPEMKAALFENNMRIKYIVTISEEYWAHAYGAEKWVAFSEAEKEKKRSETYDFIDQFLVGSKNAYKSVFVDGKVTIDGKVNPYIDFKALPDTTQQGELLPDSAAANSEIAFAMLFNPAIIGASLPSGPYTNSQGGSNVREALLMQVIIHEFERQLIRQMMNVVKYFNGWHQKHPGLEFIIPATVLTTLDTGAGTKNVITGASHAPQNSATNDADSKDIRAEGEHPNA